jgi:hypothetical protein
VIETLRTESFLTNIPPSGCFSLTDMVAAMNSGIRVRESIRSAAQTIDARGRSAEGRSMDRDLGTPKKSQESTSACVSFEHVWCWGMSRVGACASRFADETNAPTPARFTARYAASSKSHHNDGTFNKESYR